MHNFRMIFLAIQNMVKKYVDINTNCNSFTKYHIFTWQKNLEETKTITNTL